MIYYYIYLAVINVFNFFLYIADKQKAKHRSWRTPEKVMLSLSFVGGAYGGYLAMLLCRHKTKHWYFQVINILGILIHSAIIVYFGIIK